MIRMPADEPTSPPDPRALFHDRIRRLHWRRVWPNALLIIGFLLLGYVAWAYSAMWYEQRHLKAEWNADHAPASAPGAPALANDGLVRVLIPKADVDAIVVDGVTRKQLAVGPGHMPSSPMPGELGNSVISAHRDTFFRKIIGLHDGDEVIVHRAGRVFHFAVIGKKIVSPNDLSVLDPTPDAELTLITCYPTYFIGPAPKRLIVTAKLQSSNAESAPKANASSTAGDASE
jgi:sortase A